MTHAGRTWDVIVVGGGIAGISLAAALSTELSVCVLEKESGLAQHTTGKSVATFIQSYGNSVIRALNAASLSFFAEERGVAGEPLARPLPFIYAAGEGETPYLQTVYDDAGPLARDMEFVDGRAAEAFNPLLRPGWTARGLIDPHVFDIDVHALMQRFVTEIRRGGGVVETGAEVLAARREGDRWLVGDARGVQRRAAVVVNASGAWADSVAEVFGAAPRGIRPLRRSVFTVPIPAQLDGVRVPMTNMAYETFYMKPEGPQLLCSPADETPTLPTDTRADEWEIARALDAMAEATVLDTRHVGTTWAGLRSFAADRVPVVGFDGDVDGFFWHAGPGGYGIQTSPALSRLGAALVMGRDAQVPEWFGVDAGALSPSRSSVTVAS